MSNRFAAFEEEAKPKGRKTTPKPVAAKSTVVEAPRTNNNAGRGRGNQRRQQSERGRSSGHEEGRQPKHLYDRKTAGGNPRAKKGGAGNRNWGNDQEEVVAQETVSTDVTDVVPSVAGEGEQKVVEEEVEDLGPPTKSLEEFQAEREANQVVDDRKARGSRNAGFAGKKVVAASNNIVAESVKVVAKQTVKKSISLDEFAPGTAARREAAPRDDNFRGGRGEGRGRGRGRGDSRGRGGRGRGGDRRNNRRDIDLKNERAFPSLG